VIWNKGKKGKCPLKTNWGTYKSPKEPVNVAVHEQIIVWSNQVFSLEMPDGGAIDITEDEFKEFAFSVWDVGPYVAPYNPHPTSFCPELVSRILKFWSYQNSNVLDCYHGIGNTAKTCKILHRNYTGVELNSGYCVYAQELLKSDTYHVGKKALQKMLKNHKDVLRIIGL
jgi:DNA modification methylase